MPAVSKSQRKLFALALAVKRGDVDASTVDQKIRDLSKKKEADLKDFAETPEETLPNKLEDSVDENNKYYQEAIAYAEAMRYALEENNAMATPGSVNGMGDVAAPGDPGTQSGFVTQETGSGDLASTSELTDGKKKKKANSAHKFLKYNAFVGESVNEYGPMRGSGNRNYSTNDLVDRIGDLDDILMYDRKAEREWEKMSQNYLDGEKGSEYWGDLGDQELQNAIDDAEYLMKKYRIKESVNEAAPTDKTIKPHMSQYSVSDDPYDVAVELGKKYGWNQSQIEKAEKLIRKKYIKESVNEAKDNLYLQLHKKYAEQIKGLKAKKIKKLTDLVSVQRWSMEDRDDYFDMDPKKKKELSAEYDNERKLFKKYMARDYSVMLPKGTESLRESVDEAKDDRSHILLRVAPRNVNNMAFKLQDMHVNHRVEDPKKGIIKVYTDPTSGWYGNEKAQYKLSHDVWVDKFVVRESVNEAEKYNTKEFKVGDKIKTNIGEWEIIETNYKPNKSFAAPFIFKGNDMKRLNIPNPPKTNKNAIGYKVTDGDKFPIIGFLYQYGDITKLATVGVDESEVNEAVDVKDIHFEIDPEKQEKMKLEFGARLGGVTRRQKLDDANYELKRFRKKIKYWSGNTRDEDWAIDVFVPNHYHAIKSSLGNGPHSKKSKPVKWNQKKYDQWIEDMASGDGWKHSHDMAQNATMEKGLVDWVKKNRTDGEDPLERIQWDIEAMGE